MIKLLGYDKLGRNEIEGIRYAWLPDEYTSIVESAAFINRIKGSKENICGYTTSVSVGCILRCSGQSCRFCRTGTQIPFIRTLTAKEIAKQNIFMVLSDLYCDEHENIKTSKREFAYMGQGEPGYSYPQVRKAIQITNYVMEKLNQEVYRHIVATSGVIEMIDLIKQDIESEYFNSKITLHFSLHGTENRSLLMPINNIYPYEEIIKKLEDVSKISGDKVCIGILLFNEFSSKMMRGETYSTNINNLAELVNILNPEHFRLSFCKYNNSKEVGMQENFEQDKALEIENYFISKGYETKLFYSFGEEEDTACGLLFGKKPDKMVSDKWIKLQQYADELIEEALNHI